MKDKNILVIGGTSGIGLEVVHQLHEAGANLWVASRNPSDELQQKNITHIPLDVNSDQVQEALSEIPEHLHGLVYAPGSITLKPFKGLKLEDFQSDFDLNVKGAVKVIQQCLKPLKKSKDASIVLYSTVAAQNGMNFHASIATAKAAIEGLGRTLAAELAPQNIRTNVIAPSLTNTPLAENLLSTEEKQKASHQRHPLQRYGEKGDIAGLTKFLLSPDATWITGQVIGVDGGISGIRNV